jgi:hypothetical protein
MKMNAWRNKNQLKFIGLLNALIKISLDNRHGKDGRENLQVVD